MENGEKRKKSEIAFFLTGNGKLQLSKVSYATRADILTVKAKSVKSTYSDLLIVYVLSEKTVWKSLKI